MVHIPTLQDIPGYSQRRMSEIPLIKYIEEVLHLCRRRFRLTLTRSLWINFSRSHISAFNSPCPSENLHVFGLLSTCITNSIETFAPGSFLIFTVGPDARDSLLWRRSSKVSTAIRCSCFLTSWPSSTPSSIFEAANTSGLENKDKKVFLLFRQTLCPFPHSTLHRPLFGVICFHW